MAMPVKACAAPICPPNQMRTSADHRDDDGEEQAADRDRHQVHRRGRRQRAEAVQEHGQDEQLDEKQRHAARPQPLMHGLLQINRNHA